MKLHALFIFLNLSERFINVKDEDKYFKCTAAVKLSIWIIVFVNTSFPGLQCSMRKAMWLVYVLF